MGNSASSEDKTSTHSVEDKKSTQPPKEIIDTLSEQAAKQGSFSVTPQGDDSFLCDSSLSDSLVDDEYYFVKCTKSVGSDSLNLSAELDDQDEEQDWFLVQCPKADSEGEERRSLSSSTGSSDGGIQRRLKIVDTKNTPGWWDSILSPFTPKRSQCLEEDQPKPNLPSQEELLKQIHNLQIQVSLLNLKWEHVASGNSPVPPSPVPSRVVCLSTSPTTGVQFPPTPISNSLNDLHSPVHVEQLPTPTTFQTPSVASPTDQMVPSQVCETPQTPAVVPNTPESQGTVQHPKVEEIQTIETRIETPSAIPEPAFHPPAVDVPPPPPPPPLGKITPSRPKEKAPKEITQEDVDKKLRNLLEAATNLHESNRDLAFKNFMKVFSFPNSLRILHKLVEDYNFLVKVHPLDPSKCFKIMLRWEAQLFSKLTQKDREYYFKTKWYQIANTDISDDEQVDQQIQFIFKDIQLRKQKELEKLKIAEQSKKQNSLIGELKEKQNASKRQEMEQQRLEQLEQIKTEEIDMSESQLLASLLC